MRNAIRTLGLSTILALAGSPALAVKGDVNLFLGQNSLAEDRLDESDVGTTTEFGFLVNLDSGWPVALAVDIFQSSDDAAKDIPAAYPLSIATDVETLDLHVGVRRFFRQDRPFRLYLGGGVAWIRLDVEQIESGSFGPGAEFSDVVIDDSDLSLGYWLDAGLLYRFERFQLGADVRFADAKATVTPMGGSGSFELDSGGLHAGVFVGWSW